MFEFLGTTQGKIATTAGLGVAVLLGLYFYSCTSSTPSSVSARDKASNAAPQAPMKAEKPASDAKAQTASNSDASESARPTPDMATEGLGPSTSPSTTRVQAPETSTAPRGLDLRSGDPTPAPLGPPDNVEGESKEDDGFDMPYGWAQSEDEILMVFPIPPDSTSKLVKVTILSKKLRVVVKGQVLVDGQLERAVLPDDSTWAIETLETGAKRLTVTLSKVDDVNGYNFWPCVIKGHPQVDPYERPIEMTKNPLLDG